MADSTAKGIILVMWEGTDVLSCTAAFKAFLLSNHACKAKHVEFLHCWMPEF